MVNNRALKQVREQRHFDVRSVANYTGISPDRLNDFESGDREPSVRQLEKLAETYGLPSYLLGVDSVPNLPEVLPDFRKKEVGPAQISPAGMSRIWSAEKTAFATGQLWRALDFSPATFSRSETIEPPSPSLAQEFRASFDEWYREKIEKLAFSGKPEQLFFNAFRLFLEVQGSIVRVNDAPPTDYLGFYLSNDETPPTVFVNRSISSHKAQLFTLLHEYAHELLGAVGISNPFKARNAVERQCNIFAAEFLAPLREFTAAAEDQPRTIRLDVFKFVDAVSVQSLLSKHATAIRLLETNFISRAQLATWDAARQKFTPREFKDEDSDEPSDPHFAPPHAKRIGEVGYLPIYLAGKALEKKLIDSFDVQQGLSLSESLQEKAISLVTRRFEVASE